MKGGLLRYTGGFEDRPAGRIVGRKDMDLNPIILGSFNLIVDKRALCIRLQKQEWAGTDRFTFARLPAEFHSRRTVRGDINIHCDILRESRA